MTFGLLIYAGLNTLSAADSNLYISCYVHPRSMAMTFADVATSTFFRLYRLHRPVVVTKDGVDMVDALLTVP